VVCCEATQAHCDLVKPTAISRQKGIFTVGKRILVAIVAMALYLSCVAVSFAATPPPQPASGPGGSDYPHAGYAVVHEGSGNYEYWMYEPRDPQPSSAPLVVFNHGWLAMDPVYYQAWLDHLVKKGNIVIYPRYQEGWQTPPSTITDNAITAVHNALDYLQSHPEDTQPQLDKFAILGHSYGGVVTVNMANRWQSEGLPQPRAIMPTEPYSEAIDSTLTGIPSTVLMNCHVGQDDTVVGRAGCDLIWNRTSHIPVANKDYVWMFTDTYGDPDLLADHMAPVTGGGYGWVDATDYYAYWKTFDGLRNCAFYGTDCSYGLGDTQKHRYMGLWSDDQPVTELGITDYIPNAEGNPVGGIAEAPDEEGSALDVPESAHGSSVPYAAIAGIAVGGAIAAAGAWYGRRRWRAG
jgi:dienelactone hydrolase